MYLISEQRRPQFVLCSRYDVLNVKIAVFNLSLVCFVASMQVVGVTFRSELQT